MTEPSPQSFRLCGVALTLIRPDTELAQEAALDLRADFEETEWIAACQRDRLIQSLAEIERAALLPATLRELRDELCRLRGRYEILLEQLAGLRAAVRPDLVRELAEDRRRLADVIRTLQGVSAALIVAADWQSPSFDHSVQSNAGRFVGRVTEHHDDYRRDRHPEGAGFEERWLSECVERAAGLKALMTGSGMSAFTTILAFLAARARRPVLMGRSCYHECRQLVHQSGLGPVVEVDEMDPEAVIAAAADRRPGVIFLDSLSNSATVAVPDLRRIVEGLRGELTVVIDNTGLSVSCQPFVMPRNPRVRLIVFESLTKYAQMGLDRVTAGMIVASGEDAGWLDSLREHLGTNVADASVHAVPPPDRVVLERRLVRLDRNAMLLAEHVQRHAAGAIDGAVHPALPSHRSHRVARGLPFRGGFFALGFRDGHDRTRVHRRFVRAMLDEARRLGVPLVAGASFGLNTTRVYLTASTSDWGRPFVRIAAGTEHRLEVEALERVLSHAIRSSVG